MAEFIRDLIDQQAKEKRVFTLASIFGGEPEPPDDDGPEPEPLPAAA